MSFSTVCGLTMARALAAGLVGTLVCGRIECVLHNTSGRSRSVLFLLLMLPWFAPELLVAYAWSSFSLSLLHREVANQLFYTLLVTLKFVPVGALVLLFAPPSPVSTEGMYSDQLLRGRGRFSSLAIRLRGPVARSLIAGVVVFLLVFQEFEIASIMSIPAWTVTLFDLHAQGIRPARMLVMLLLPLAIELAALGPLIWLCRRRGEARSSGAAAPVRPLATAANWCFITTALLLLVVIPLFLVIRSGASGFSAFLRNSTMVTSFLTEVRDALLLSATAALMGMWLASLMAPSLKQGRKGTAFALLIPLLPGLCGAMAVSIGMLLCVQAADFLALKNTPFPALFAVVLFLLPRAVLLQTLFLSVRPSEALHAARLLQNATDPQRQSKAARICWQLEHRASFWLFAILFYWGYLNLTVTDLVRPAWIVPIPVRLYNLMHYGQNGPLSVMTLLSVAIPLALLAILAVLLPRLTMLARRSHQQAANTTSSP